MPLSQLLIHKESQFNALRKKFQEYAGCACCVNLKQIRNNLIIILTTQRTGSTLLCHDIESGLDLEYTPTESFIPLLSGFSNRGIRPEEIAGRIESHLQSFASGGFTVIKCMIDYVGWLGFFCAERDWALRASYKELSAYFIDSLKCIDEGNSYMLLRLDRKDKLKQSVSRLINAMGLPTHITSSDDATEFERMLEEKLVKYPDYHCMIVDQLGIILRQISLLDGCLDLLKTADAIFYLGFEDDLLKRKDLYLQEIFMDTDVRVSRIKRKLLPTSGVKSKEMLQRLMDAVNLS